MNAERVVRMHKAISIGILLRKNSQTVLDLTPSPRQMLVEMSDIVKRMCFVCGKLLTNDTCAEKMIECCGNRTCLLCGKVERVRVDDSVEAGKIWHDPCRRKREAKSPNGHCS